MARTSNPRGVASQINRNYGPRRNMNGAGAGGRLVYNRKRGVAGQSQLGSRRQRYADLRISQGLSAG